MTTLKKYSSLFTDCLCIKKFNKKKGITWLPSKLFHIPETNNEEKNVVGESFLDICRENNLA